MEDNKVSCNYEQEYYCMQEKYYEQEHKYKQEIDEITMKYEERIKWLEKVISGILHI